MDSGTLRKLSTVHLYMIAYCCYLHFIGCERQRHCFWNQGFASVKATQHAHEAFSERCCPERVNEPNPAAEVIKCPFSTTADSLQLHVL